MIRYCHACLCCCQLHACALTTGGRFVPSILSPCDGVGTEVPNTDVILVQRGQTNPIPAGCNVCIRQSSELWLTLTCPTNVVAMSFTWTDEERNVVGDENTLLVSEPGIYTCTAYFEGGERDNKRTSVGCGLIYIYTFHVFCFKQPWYTNY